MTSVSEVCITVRRTGPRDHRSPVRTRLQRHGERV